MNEKINPIISKEIQILLLKFVKKLPKFYSKKKNYNYSAKKNQNPLQHLQKKNYSIKVQMKNVINKMS